jgi:hypothetical protein
MWLAVSIQILVPTLLTGAIAIQRQSSRLRWLVNCVAFSMVLGYLLLSARWDISSLHLRVAIPVAFVAAAVVGYKRISRAAAGGRLQAVVFWTVNLGLIVLMSGYLWFSIRGNLVPAQAVDLQSPLHGNYAVLNGGNSPFTNAHFRVRPQDFALDIVGVNALGNRAALFGSSWELESYVIYGSAILSPCDGKVSAVVNDLPDHVPPDRDTENPAGNYVLIECEEVEVLLAHMQQGSVTVAVNDEVAAGDHLGKVGNSGNTTEPHLHIHAERGGEPGVILDGQAVPITIAGRYLVRNSVFRGE